MYAIVHGRETLSIRIALMIGPRLDLDPTDILFHQLKTKIQTVQRKMAAAHAAPRP